MEHFNKHLQTFAVVTVLVVVGAGVGQATGYLKGYVAGYAKSESDAVKKQEETRRQAEMEAAKAVNPFEAENLFETSPANPFEDVNVNPFE